MRVSDSVRASVCVCVSASLVLPSCDLRSCDRLYRTKPVIVLSSWCFAGSTQTLRGFIFRVLL